MSDRARALAERQRRILRAVAFGALGFALLVFVSKGFYWFWPWALRGLANEAGLLGVGLAVGAAIAGARPGPVGRAAGAAGLAIVYAMLSFLWIGWLPGGPLGFDAYRHYVFSSDACDFTAELPRPPAEGSVPQGALKDTPELDIVVAVLSDLETLTAFRVDCVGLRPGVARPTGLDLASLTEASLAGWAERSGLTDLRRERIDGPDGPIFSVEGTLAGSVLGAASDGARTLARARAYLGPRSVLTLYVLQADEGRGLPPSAETFLASGRAKRGG